MVSEKSQVKTAIKELEKELNQANKHYVNCKGILDAHNEERAIIANNYDMARKRVEELEAAKSTLSTLTQ